MSSFTEIISVNAECNKESVKKAISILERTHMSIAGRLFVNPRNSEDYKIARDLVNLQGKISRDATITDLKLHSKTIAQDQVILSLSDKHELSKENLQLLETQVVAPNEHYITFSFMLDAILHERAMQRTRWFLNLVLVLLVGVLGALGNVIGSG